MKFAIALAFIAAGVAPIVVAFPEVLKIVRALWAHGAIPSVLVKNPESYGTSSLIVTACILAFSCGLTLAVVSLGRTLEFAKAASTRRPRSFSYLSR